MKNKILLACLIITNILVVGGFLFFNSKTSNVGINFKENPTEIIKNSSLILVRGAVKKESRYLISKNTSLANLIDIAGGFTVDANIDLFYKNYSTLDLSSLSSIYVPYKGNTKLFINFASVTEISEFFNIDDATSEKIRSNKPFLSIKEVEITLKNLKIQNSKEIIL